jgi:diacylglycerol kinase (ATP)
MRAAAILGLGCSQKDLTPFQTDKASDWQIGMPSAGDPADVILLFGGDGTIHRHLGQLVKLGLPVLVVPAGSGNDFARALGLRSVRDSIAAWRRFCAGANNVRTIDLGMIEPGMIRPEPAGESPAPHEPARNSGLGTRYFCCVAGVGLDGEVARRANALPRWLRGHGGYALSLVPAILRFAPLPIKIVTRAIGAGELHSGQTSDWQVRSDQPTALVVFANTPVYGGGMKVAPRALMDDGLLDVCLVTHISRFKLFGLFPTVYFGRHLNMAEVEYFQSGSVRVETERPLDVYADGEYVCQTPIGVGVAHAALRVLVP